MFKMPKSGRRMWTWKMRSGRALHHIFKPSIPRENRKIPCGSNVISFFPRFLVRIKQNGRHRRVELIFLILMVYNMSRNRWDGQPEAVFIVSNHISKNGHFRVMVRGCHFGLWQCSIIVLALLCYLGLVWLPSLFVWCLFCIINTHGHLCTILSSIT